MLVNHRYGFLFVHIPKTGGTSIRAALAPLRLRDPLYWLMFPCHRLSHLTGHRLAVKLPRHAKAIAAKEMLPRKVFDGLFKFAFVRNPWDLQVSSYHHLRRERPHLVASLKDFEHFIRHKLDPKRPPQFHLDVSAQRQVDYLRDLSGDVIVDFVGRYEQLEDDFAEVCSRIGIPPRPLPHRRRAISRRDYRSYYDDLTAELVARHFAEDIEAFGYRFDP